MKPTPPLPKRLPKRPRNMTLERYNFLVESFWGFWHVIPMVIATDRRGPSLAYRWM